MRHWPCEQGSEKWLRLRMGRPTASEFERIIQPVKWEPTKSATRRTYLVYLVTELALDTPLSNVSSAAMQHGNDWEAKALATYEMMMSIDTEPAGFCTNDAGTIGASPDFFVGSDGTGEIKSPFKPEIHMGYVLDNQSLVTDYFVQTQGQLYVTGRKWTDLVSCFAGMPLVRVRVEPVPEFQSKLESALNLFVADLRLLIDMAREKGCSIAEPSTEPAAPNQKRADDDGGFLGVSQDDITEYLKNIELKREAQTVQGAKT